MTKELTNNEKAGYIGIVGGVLMLLAGVTGAAAWTALGELTTQIIGNDSLNLVFQILALVGSLGGIVVILGGLMITGKIMKAKKDKAVSSGKLLITLGAGFGLIGLIIFIILALLGDNPGIAIFTALGIGMIGLIMSIIARQKAQK